MSLPPPARSETTAIWGQYTRKTRPATLPSSLSSSLRPCTAAVAARDRVPSSTWLPPPARRLFQPYRPSSHSVADYPCLPSSTWQAPTRDVVPWRRGSDGGGAAAASAFLSATEGAAFPAVREEAGRGWSGPSGPVGGGPWVVFVSAEAKWYVWLADPLFPFALVSVLPLPASMRASYPPAAPWLLPVNCIPRRRSSKC